jgi:hypothetical protein
MEAPFIRGNRVFLDKFNHAANRRTGIEIAEAHFAKDAIDRADKALILVEAVCAVVIWRVNRQVVEARLALCDRVTVG